MLANSGPSPTSNLKAIRKLLVLEFREYFQTRPSMEKDQLSRKLAVILHADVVGSAVLVQKNETLAHARIQATFRDFSETIKAYGGIVREIRGDAIVAEFNRASDAVVAAVAFQAKNEEKNLAYEDDIRLQLRIGISLGEVVIADNTITGAGVVIAQRLEQLAEPGGIVVQTSVADTVPVRLPFEFTSLGEQTLKGFDKPVTPVLVALNQGAEIPQFDGIAFEPEAQESSLQIPDVPSIAILPFTNMSSDPEQEFFSDGISEDIITALSKVSTLFVVARNSTFIYKEKAVDIKQVGCEQGVRYVLEGSVRKSGERVRVTAQLIDAITGNHLWAERFDRDLRDIFEVQDEITQKVVNALDIELVLGEQARLWAGGTKNLEAWECFRLGQDLLSRYRSEDLPKVKSLLERAVELDPEYSFAWSLLAGYYNHFADDPGLTAEERHEAVEKIRECAEKALEFDPTCSKAYGALGMYYLNKREYETAEQYALKIVELSPNHANDQAIAAIIMNKCGNPEKALKQIKKAMRLSPIYPMWFLTALGQILRVQERYDESIKVFWDVVGRDPELCEAHIGLAQVLGETERFDEAKKSAAEVLRIDPDFSIKEYVRTLSYRDPNQIARIKVGLQNAGLPE